MEEASTVDMRGHTVLPFALRIIALEADRATRRCEARSPSCAPGRGSGAHRIDRDRNGSYDHAEAIRIMDAWWEPLLRAEFEPTLGKELFDAIAGINVLDDSPSLHLGSAYNGGWYVYANKDLRHALLGAGQAGG